MAKQNALKRNVGPTKAIPVTCHTDQSLPLDQIVAFQGELKTLSEQEFKKLKASIVKYGLSFPSYIWKQNGSMKCLDGHQRSRVLGEMQKEGYEIPPIPVVYVDAKNEKEAKEKILLLSSQYGKYSEESLFEFWAAAGLDFDDMGGVLDLPQINMDHFGLNFFGDPNVDGADAPLLKSTDREAFQQMTFTLHDSQVRTVVDAMSKAKEEGGTKSEVNENKNGNALAWIAQKYLNGNS